MLAALKSHGYKLRDYQIQSAHDAFELLKQGKNVEVDLPTGTGKTLIANQASWLWLTSFEHARVLYIVPRRILVGQHRSHARWMAPSFLILDISTRRLCNVFRFRPLLHAHKIIVSTPRILSNAIHSAIFPSDYLSKIELVIVDEYDGFLVLDYGERDIYVRWHQDLEELLSFLPNKARFLFLTATSPLSSSRVGSPDILIGEFADFVRNGFDPVSLEIDPGTYRQYIPTASITFLKITDEWVRQADEALKTEKEIAIRRFEDDNGVAVDREYLFSRLEGIIHFKTKVLLVYEDNRSKFIPVSDEVIRLCFHLRDILSKYSFLFEDMFDGFSIEWRQIVAMIDGEFKTVNRPFLIDQRSSNSFQVQLRGKGAVLRKLVQQHAGQRGVIFARFIHLSDEVCTNLADSGIPLFRIDGRLNDVERESTLADFKKTKPGLLVITRDTGKRGLDLPQADYAIFYSPKSSEHSVWQEVSRIRSNIDRTKESFFLCYQSTSEEERMVELDRQMALSKRLYERRQEVIE